MLSRGFAEKQIPFFVVCKAEHFKYNLSCKVAFYNFV